MTIPFLKAMRDEDDRERRRMQELLLPTFVCVLWASVKP
jgi:hypothetical protein